MQGFGSVFRARFLRSDHPSHRSSKGCAGRPQGFNSLSAFPTAGLGCPLGSRIDRESSISRERSRQRGRRDSVTFELRTHRFGCPLSLNL